MAELVLSDIAVGLISKLSSSVLKEIGVWWGVNDELDKLKRTISTIESVLLHAEEQSMENPQVKNWLGMLSEALYDADDLLDEFSTEALRQQVMGGPQMVKKVRLFSSSSNQFAFGLKMGHKVKSLRERLDEVAAEKNKFHLEDRSGVGRVFVARGRDQTHSSPPQVVIGREHDKEEIVELLLSSDYVENVSVVAIVGFGGLGKTTLAQLVYNDDRVRNHFQLKMWVCVSDDFDLQLLVKNVLESAFGQAPSNTQMEQLKNLLHEKINGRKYLLVLDDVWNEDVNKWLSFKDLLAGGARGSKIVITTRLRKVAEMSRPISIHELRGLSENESWSLFKHVAFKEGQAPNPKYEALGRKIVAKCCGVPLAIKTIGGMLYFKDLESLWVLFKEKELSMIDVYKNDILPILKLSYNHLPSQYKHCFAYCSLYPKDYRIPVEDLIKLWRAQGYLKSTDPNECLHEVGLEYFMDLFRMSFFQDIERDEFGNIECCRMHDLMHDLAIFVAGDNFSASHSGVTSIKDKTQHMSFQVRQNSFSQDVSSLLKAKKVRTLLTMERFDGIHIEKEELDVLFRNLRCLRVLDLCALVGTLPSSIYKLKHLRYLDLSGNNVKKLPDSITNLQNLQVLKLRRCIKLMQLPNNIRKLINLTDLDNCDCIKLTHVPQGIGQLTRLEKLSRFVIAKDHSISKHIGGLDELHALNNLRGELEIVNLDCVKNVAFEFEAADLSSKQHLQKLVLCWNRYGNENDNCSAIDIGNDELGLEELRPHQNLKALWMFEYRGVKLPSWLASITNLVDLKLERCSNCLQLPRLGDLPHLEFLTINHLGKVKCVDNEFYGVDIEGSSTGCLRLFPALKSLSIRWMENLTDWSSPSDGDKVLVFPCLENLSIQFCPKLTGFPMSDTSKLVKLEIKDCEELKLLLDRQQSLVFLKSLSITGCSKLTYLRNWLLSITSVKELSVRRCEWLTFIPEDLGKVCYLTSLEIYCCKRLRYFPEQILCMLRQLQNLRVGAFSEELDDFSYLNRVKDLPCLEEIEIWGSDFLGREIRFLPNQLQHLTRLKLLKIMGFTAMEALPEWLTNLKSLFSLSLDYCRNLGCRSTATVIQRLPNLKYLNVNCCPVLEESKSEWLQSLDTTKVKVEFSLVSKVTARL